MCKAIFLTVFLMSLSACGGAGNRTPEDGQAKAEGAEPAEPTAVAIEAAKQVDAERFREKFLAEVGALRPKWSEIEFLDSSDRSYRFAIIYREAADIDGYSEVADDTKYVSRAALRTLMAEGRKPSEEWISVVVHARQPAGSGETGRPMTRVLGKSRYDFNTDLVTFSPPE